MLYHRATWTATNYNDDQTRSSYGLNGIRTPSTAIGFTLSHGAAAKHEGSDGKQALYESLLNVSVKNFDRLESIQGRFGSVPSHNVR